MSKKIVFFGTSKFAIPALEALIGAGYEVAAVVTQPDRPAGRKQEPLPSPVKQVALKLGLKVVQPQNLDSKFQVRDSDLFIVASYGEIIPKTILDLPKFGVLNIHPSLLPKHRGPSPIQAAILSGDRETGVSIIKLDEEMDHGPILAKSKFQITDSKIEFKNLHDQLAKLGTDLLIETLPKCLAGKLQPIPQDHAKATFTKIITKSDGRIDWKKPAKEIDRMVRAYHLWPVAWTMLDGRRLKIYSSTSLPLTNGAAAQMAGEVETSTDKLFVSTGGGFLEIVSLQLEGGKRLTAADFLRGHPNLSGKLLI